jgi:TetR/AcrR family transcriptional repressor of nem operon
MSPRPSKRPQILQSALQLVYDSGFRSATLADIAATAQVPLGSVYYYFRTKDELGLAVIDAYLEQYRSLCERWEALPEPRDRLVAFVEMTIERKDELAVSGCPLGTLCSELGKGGGPVAEHARALFGELLGWLEVQLRALGQGEDARGQAVHLLSALEGATLLAHSQRDPSLVDTEARRMIAWLHTLETR